MKMFGNFFFNLFKSKPYKYFKYKQAVNTWGRKFYKPITTIYIKHTDSSWHPYSFFLDSGADITVVGKSIGNLIGLKLKPKETKYELKGIGGKQQFVYRDINIKIITKIYKIKIAWVQQDDIPLLLGREGVFDKYKICFMEKEKRIMFTEN